MSDSIKREQIRFVLTCDVPITAIDPSCITPSLRKLGARVLGDVFNQWLSTCYHVQQEGAEMIGDMEHVHQPRDGEEIPVDIRVVSDYTVDSVLLTDTPDIDVEHITIDNRTPKEAN